MDATEKKPKQRKLQQHQQQKKLEQKKKQRQQQKKPDTAKLPDAFLQKFPGYSQSELYKAARFLYAFTQTYKEYHPTPVAEPAVESPRVATQKTGIVISAASGKTIKNFFKPENEWARTKLHEAYGATFSAPHNTKMRMTFDRDDTKQNQKKTEVVLQAFLTSLDDEKPLTEKALNELIHGPEAKAEVQPPSNVTEVNIYTKKGKQTPKKKGLNGFFHKHGDLARAIGFAFDVTLEPGKEKSLLVASKGKHTKKMERQHRQVGETMQTLVQRAQDGRDIGIKDVMTIVYGVTKNNADALQIQKKLRYLKKHGLPPAPVQVAPVVTPQTDEVTKKKTGVKRLQPFLGKKAADTTEKEKTKEKKAKKERLYTSTTVKKKDSISAAAVRAQKQKTWAETLESNRNSTAPKPVAKRNRSVARTKSKQPPIKEADELTQYHFTPVTVDGAAIDNANTEKCHSVFSIYKDPVLRQLRLDHAIIAPNFLRNATTNVPKDFFHNVKSGWQDRALKRKSIAQYEFYFRQLMHGQACLEGFSEDVYKPALVHSFILNEKDNYAITDSFMTHGVAKMSWQFDYTVINKMKKRAEIDPETHMWYEAMRRQTVSGTRQPGEKHSIQSAMEKMVKLSQGLAGASARQHNIEMIHQVPGEKLTEEFKNNKNKNSFVCTSKLIEQNIPSEYWHTPITNDNLDVSLINRGLMYYHFASNGRRMLAPHIVGALAMAYQTNFNSGKEATPLQPKLVVADESAFHLKAV